MAAGEHDRLAALIGEAGTMPDADVAILTVRLTGMLTSRRRDRVAGPAVFDLIDRLATSDLNEKYLAAAVAEWARDRPPGTVLRMRSRLSTMLGALPQG